MIGLDFWAFSDEDLEDLSRGLGSVALRNFLQDRCDLEKNESQRKVMAKLLGCPLLEIEWERMRRQKIRAEKPSV